MELKILDWIQIIHVSWLDKLFYNGRHNHIRKRGSHGLFPLQHMLIIPKMRKAGTAMAVSLALEVSMLQCDIKTVDSKNQALRCKRGSASSYQASGRFFISFRAYRRGFCGRGRTVLWKK